MIGRPRRFGASLLTAAINFHRDNCLDMAATVAFYTLLSLGPFLYLAGVFLEWSLDIDGALGSALGRIGIFLPPETETLIGTIERDLQGDRPLFLLAIPGLIWVASSAISSLEYSINVANGSAPLRRFWHSRLKSLAVLTTGFGLLSVSLIVGSLVPRLESLRTRLQIPGEPLNDGIIDSWPMLLSGTLLAFTAFYKWLPRGRIRWRSAFGGSLLALVLWESARAVFTEFLERSPSFGLMQGTLAGVVAFLIWIYTAVAIVLVGAELSSALNGREARR